MSGALAIVVAAGSGERLGLGPKAFVEIGGRTILSMAVERVSQVPQVIHVVVVVPPGSEQVARSILSAFPAITVTAGGASRHASVAAGLAVQQPLPERIIVHDAARPFASLRLFTSVLEALDGWDGVVPLLSITDTLKRTREETVIGTEPRGGLALAQTPQAFRSPALVEAHRRAGEAAQVFSDDAGCLEWAGFRVRAVPGEPGNRKITTVEDLRDVGVGTSGDPGG